MQWEKFDESVSIREIDRRVSKINDRESIKFIVRVKFAGEKDDCYEERLANLSYYPGLKIDLNVQGITGRVTISHFLIFDSLVPEPVVIKIDRDTLPEDGRKVKWQSKEFGRISDWKEGVVTSGDDLLCVGFRENQSEWD